MHKANIIILVCMVTSVAMVGSTFALLAQKNSSNISPEHDTLTLNVEGYTQNDSHYSLYLEVSNVTEPTCLIRFFINQVNQENITGLTVFLNQTAVDASKPLQCNLKSGDTMQINLAMPSTNYLSEKNIEIAVQTPQAMYYQEFDLQ